MGEQASSRHYCMLTARLSQGDKVPSPGCFLSLPGKKLQLPLVGCVYRAWGHWGKALAVRLHVQPQQGLIAALVCARAGFNRL